MDLEYKHLLPESFSQESKVWVYQCNRLLRLSEALEAEEAINAFCTEWRSHGARVEAWGNLFFGQFLVLIADESSTGVSGCSTDSSVRFVKELGQKFAVDFFDRTNLAFVVKDKIQMLPLSQVAYAVKNNFIDENTLYFNNAITTKQQLETSWIIPVKDSWLSKKLQMVS
jgi:hypothetical protein